MTIAGELALPVANGRFARTSADALIQLIRTSNAYRINLERAWMEELEEARLSLSNGALVTLIRDTLRQNQERRKPG
jgi:hypothetical protein